MFRKLPFILQNLVAWILHYLCSKHWYNILYFSDSLFFKLYVCLERFFSFIRILCQRGLQFRYEFLKAGTTAVQSGWLLAPRHVFSQVKKKKKKHKYEYSWTDQNLIVIKCCQLHISVGSTNHGLKILGKTSKQTKNNKKPPESWLIHINVWQKPLQYCKVISLQLK